MRWKQVRNDASLSASDSLFAAPGADLGRTLLASVPVSRHQKRQLRNFNHEEGEDMPKDVFKGITIVGTSNESFSEAIQTAVERANQTIRELRWFEVLEQRGAVRDGQIEYQVTLEVFFKLNHDDSAK